jgi:hypothetical protein
MKIIPMPNLAEPTPPSRASVPASEKPVLSADTLDPLKKEFEALKVQTLGELNRVQERFEKAHAQGLEQIRQNTKEIARLTEAIEGLWKTITDLEKPAPAPVPLPPIEVAVPIESKPAPIETPLHHSLLDDLAGSIPEPSGKKVAFLTKLWDYLNQVAFEIPLGKSDRTQ